MLFLAVDVSDFENVHLEITLVVVGQNQSFSIIRVVINFDFRHGAKKSVHLDHLLQSYGQIYFNIF